MKIEDFLLILLRSMNSIIVIELFLQDYYFGYFTIISKGFLTQMRKEFYDLLSDLLVIINIIDCNYLSLIQGLWHVS